jgi:hypothetical protein
MTTATAPRLARRSADNIDPIVEVQVNPLPSSGTEEIGWYLRQDHGGKERIWNAVFERQTCELFYEPLLYCSEDGSF